jgi:hypothetical protein
MSEITTERSRISTRLTLSVGRGFVPPSRRVLRRGGCSRSDAAPLASTTPAPAAARAAVVDLGCEDRRRPDEDEKKFDRCRAGRARAFFGASSPGAEGALGASVPLTTPFAAPRRDWERSRF